jgi:predicted ABC-type ATPase
MSGAEMFIVAGPPGAGKSKNFPLVELARRIFNADDRAAEINGGSYRSIPLEVRRQVNREFETFVEANIANGTSFALETTLRSTVTFEQARMAKSVGFRVSMTYVALDSFESHLARVTIRARIGDHSASESTLRSIYQSSLANLPAAPDPTNSRIDDIQIYDNTAFNQPPRLVLESVNGLITREAENFPAWLRTALNRTDASGS